MHRCLFRSTGPATATSISAQVFSPALHTHQQLLLHREGEAHLLPQRVLPGAALLSSSSGSGPCGRAGALLRRRRLQLLQLLVELLVLGAQGLRGGGLWGSGLEQVQGSGIKVFRPPGEGIQGRMWAA